MGDMSNTAARIANGESIEEALSDRERDVRPSGEELDAAGRNYPRPSGEELDREARARRILEEATVDPDALLPDPDVVETEGVASPGDVETEGWT